MEIKVYKTSEIDVDTWGQVVKGFNDSFPDHYITSEKLIGAAFATSLGYSYHGIAWDNDKVAGFNTFTPCYYRHNGDRILCALSGSTFVLKEYRSDIFIFHDIYMALKDYCANEGMIAVLGVPNENSYQYSLKFLKCREVFSLPYYALPVRIANIQGSPNRLLNLLSSLCCKVSLSVNRIFAACWDATERHSAYRLDADDDFLDRRFSAARYRNVIGKWGRFTYTLCKEKGVWTAYIMDFRKNGAKSGRVLVKAVQYILKQEEVDIILYVGTMNVKQALLLKVPVRLEPKKLPLTYNLLVKSDEYADMADASNWDFSLLNLDVR